MNLRNHPMFPQSSLGQQAVRAPGPGTALGPEDADTQWTPLSLLLGSGLAGLVLPAPPDFIQRVLCLPFLQLPSPLAALPYMLEITISTLQGHLCSQAKGLPSAASQARPKWDARPGSPDGLQQRQGLMALLHPPEGAVCEHPLPNGRRCGAGSCVSPGWWLMLLVKRWLWGG